MIIHFEADVIDVMSSVDDIILSGTTTLFVD